MARSTSAFRPVRLAATLVAFSGTLLGLGSAAIGGTESRVTATIAAVQTQRVWAHGRAPSGERTPPFASRGPGCSQVVTSLATGFDNLDVGSEITMEAGMVEQEGFGQEYIVPDPDASTPQNEAFPITINLIEFMVASVGTISGSDGQPIKAGYIIEVFDGTPTTGTLVHSQTSTNDPDNNPGVPPDASMERLGGSVCQPCATQGLSASVSKVQYSVATNDPDQIIVQGNDQSGGVATGRFTVRVRLVRMHDPAVYGACTFGLTHDCGPLNRCNNGFMCVESLNGGALNYTTRNWIHIRSCGPLACAGGDYRFSQLSAGGGVSGACRPSRDTLIQTTYTPAICTVAVQGACCASTGACTISAGSASCSGTYQGNGIVCEPNPCPQPATGACCTNGTCSATTENPCIAGGGVFQGSGSTCGTVTCPAAGGVCCGTIFGTPYCAAGSAQDCKTLGGIYQGDGSTCVPNPPFDDCGTGACCSASGVCTSSITRATCTSQGGTYQGNGAACSPTTCPVASAACCLASGGCLVRTPSQCAGLPGATFNGASATCTPNPCAQPGVCCRGVTCAVGITQVGCTAPSPVGSAYVTGPSASMCNATNNTTSPCCHADFSKSGGIAVSDIFDFLNAWFAGSPYCRINGNGTGTPVVQDIFDFLNLWFAGGC